MPFFSREALSGKKRLQNLGCRFFSIEIAANDSFLLESTNNIQLI